MNTTRSIATGIAAWLCTLGPARADTVSLLTSFPPEMVAVYQQAFEAAQPGTKLEVIRKNTAELIEAVRRAPAGQRPDVVWASDAGAFAVLAREGLLQRAPQVRNAGIPERVGMYPMNDIDERYFGQALSGYGLMWNTRYLQSRGIVFPRDWSDLARPEYFGHVAMASPSHSGTTQLNVEVILQSQGWQQGWSQLMQIAANCATIAEQSGDVPAGIAEGRHGAGLVVDFLAFSAHARGAAVEFAYPANTAILPASVAVVAGARNPSAGERFARFTLSNAGQELLFTPQISRMPASPYAVASLKVPGNFPNVYAVARKSGLGFDLALYERRRRTVAALFDQAIVAPHAELKAAARAIHEAQRTLAGGTASAESAAQLKQAREAAFSPPVDEAAAASADPAAWAPLARDRYLRAAQLAAQAARTSRR